MMTSTRGAIFLIFFGALYLLYNLNLISFSPWGLLWPGLLIWFAGNQLVKTAKEGESQDSWNIALWLSVLALGIYMLLPKIGISVPKIPWGIVWPLVLIGIGAAKILTGKPDFIRFEIGSDKKSPGPRPRNYRSSFVGEINRGPSSWALDDLRLHQTIGTINLDLTNAIIPDREVDLEISGLVGEVSIYLPPELAFRAECGIAIGDITVLNHNESGTHRRVEMESPDYWQATRQINIKVDWKIGEIVIRQIR